MQMTPDELRDSIDYTSRLTGFNSFLIEKDYYCSLILKLLYENEELKNMLIFKGGTLLSKGYFDFFRLSEDLDFSIENSFCVNRGERKKISAIFKATIPAILKTLNFREVSPFRGFNESTQYNGIFGYDSVVGPADTIKFDVGLRGDLILKPVVIELKTLLKNSISGAELFPNINALTLAKEETYAEKFRAALTRNPFAIRDFFDVEKIMDSGFDVFNEGFISLVKMKINFDSSAKIDLTFEKKKFVDGQVKTDLKPVLKPDIEFSLDKSWALLQEIYTKISG